MTADSSTKPSYVLSIDLGTTTAKCVVMDDANNNVVSHASTHYGAPAVSIQSASEVNIVDVIDTLHHTAMKLDQSTLATVSKIVICGQMHGVILWSKKNSFAFDSLTGDFDIKQDSVSNLVTWKDKRCDTAFLDSLPRSPSRNNVSAGFGNATLAWYSRFKPDWLAKFDAAGSIMDFIVCLLIGSASDNNQAVRTSTQVAHSFGYFDSLRGSWETDKIDVAFGHRCFREQLLPTVVAPGIIVGQLSVPWLGLPTGIPVYVALGDLQCALLAATDQVKSSKIPAVLNIGTSCQLAVPMTNELTECPNIRRRSSGVEIWPYFGGSFVAVSASLNGGNVLAALVSLLADGLGSNTDKDIWARISRCKPSFDPSPVTNLRLFGERHVPSSTMSMTNITNENFTFDALVSSLCLGMVQNVIEMYPPNFFEDQDGSSGVSDIICVGDIFSKVKVLQAAVVRTLGKSGRPVHVLSEVSSAVGAALSVTGCPEI